MNSKILVVLAIFISLALLAILILNIDTLESNPSVDVKSDVKSDELFDVGLFLESQLVDNTYKVPNRGEFYDRYLTKENYEDFLDGIILNDPIINFQFNDKLIIDTNISGPENPKTIVIYPW